MPNDCQKLTLPTCARILLALAVLATVARVGQLALAPVAQRVTSPPFVGNVNGGSVTAKHPATDGTPPTAPAELDAELARLYAHCPTAAIIDFNEAMAASRNDTALVPPHRQTAARVVANETANAPPLPPAVPRIRYPQQLRAVAPSKTEADNLLRIVQAPRIAASAAPSAAPDAQGDWLIDPDEWYTPEERALLDSAQVPDGAAASDELLVEPAAPPESLPPSDEEGQQPVSAPLTSEVESESDAAREGESIDSESIDTDSSSRAEALDDAPEPELPDPPQTVAPSNQPLFAPPVAEPGREPAPSIPPTTTPEEIPPPQSPVPQSPQPAAPPLPPPPLPGAPPAAQPRGVDPHLELFAKNAYPSARQCAVCHEEIYHQWSMSAHAYAAVSPMFHKFEQKLNDLSQGTVGYFCMRCHAPVATNLYASRAEPLWNLPEVAREGVTCIACHRVQYVYGKSNGERRIEEGSVFAPVMGGIGGEGVAEAIHRREEFKLETSPHDGGPGQNIHVAGIYFDPLTRSEACTPCHQVAVHPGIKLEVVWEQYRASPACKKGIQCQDCHMGRVPGLPLGYDIGAVANVAGKTVNNQRRKSNHIFHGPNYSIAHPGVFPFHLKANRWTMDEWLLFDWRAGWGTDEFEERVADGSMTCEFPACWAEVDDRYDAREIIDENLAKLAHKRANRREVMENGSHVEGPFFDSSLTAGEDLRFHYVVTNTNEGHNLLTASLGAQPQLWANVVLIGPDGRRLWETGYTDSIGDLANIHSMDVRHGRVPYDWQLFNLQTMFLITGVKGTDREFVVPVNVDIDQLPFLRPGVQPISTINHPPFIRMESQSLAPLGARKVPYRVPGELMRQPGTYRLSFRMRSRAEPIYFMRFCNATPEMERMMNQWMIDVHPMSVEFYVKP